jgi:hypothetical protein
MACGEEKMDNQYIKPMAFVAYMWQWIRLAEGIYCTSIIANL